jgi:methylglyoxal synthase
MLPPQGIDEDTLAKCRDTARRIAKAFEITGPFNMQLIAKDGEVKIIETNVRASRSFPFSSKTVGADFIEAATSVMVGAGRPEGLAEKDLGLEGKGSYPKDYLGVKVPMFSFRRLSMADPKLGVEMSSTGEVACYGVSKEEAFLKSMLSTLQIEMPKKKAILVSIQDRLQPDFADSAKALVDNGYKLYATEKTARYFESIGVPVTQLHWEESGQTPAINEAILNKEIDQVFMFSNNLSARTETNYGIRRLATDFNVPLVTNLEVGKMLVDAYAMHAQGNLVLEPKTLKEYHAMDGRSF